MATQAEFKTGRSSPPMLPGGAIKFVHDVSAILEMKLLLMRRGWYWYLLSSLVFPIAMFYWATGMAPDDPAVLRRVMIGAMVFGVSLATVGTLAEQMIQDRFQGRLKLLITMPMSKGAYAFGVLAFAALLAASTVAVLLLFGWIAGVELTPTWALFPIAAAALLSMAGLPLLIVSFAPSAEAGG